MPPHGLTAALGRYGRAEHVREPVDVRARALLGDRHEQAAAVGLACR